MLVEAVLGGTIEAVVARALESAGFKSNGSSQPVTVDYSRMRESILRHLVEVESWAASITFRELRGTEELASHFVELDCQEDVYESRTRARAKRVYQVGELPSVKWHVVLAGRPGAGKTTSLKGIARSALGAREAGRAVCPVLLKCREFRSGESLIDHVLASLGIHVRFAPDVDPVARRHASLQIAVKALETIGALVLIDGVDEALRPARSEIERDLDALMGASAQFKVIATCRTADLQRHYQHGRTFVLRPLTDVQIRVFAQKWLGDDADRFIERVRHSPYSGVEALPLTIAHLATLFRATGDVPAKPRSVYQRVIRLLLEGWDEERAVRRESGYAAFDIDAKRVFLERVAFELRRRGRVSEFSHSDLVRVFESIHADFGLPVVEATKVAREIESHTGLILNCGQEEYEFAHRSIQEFLCAEYLVRLPSLPQDGIGDLPDELAVAVGLSSDPGALFEAVVTQVYEHEEGLLEVFLPAFLQRLVAERPDFRVASRLGWTILGIAFALSTRKRRRTSKRHSSSEVGIDTLAELGGADAVAAALTEATIALDGGARRVRLPRSGTGSVPKFVLHLMERERVDGFLLQASDFSKLKRRT